MQNLIPLIFRTVCLFLFWILLSGKLDFIHLGIGFFCSFFVAFFSISVAPPQKNASWQRFPFTFVKACLYILWLMSRIFLAAFHTAKIILDPKLPLNAGFIRHKTKLMSETEKVLFANSITLTPGTITADIVGDEFIIHQLDDESSGDILSGLMESQIEKIFSRAKQ